MGKLAKFIFFYTDEDKGVKPVPVEKNAIGNPIRIIDALVNPAVNLKAYFDPVQSGTGDPSPDNVRPISGWTECKVTRAGENVFTARNGTDSSNGTTVVFESVNGLQLITVSGTPSTTTYFDIDTDVVFNLTDFGLSVKGSLPTGCSAARVSDLGSGQYQGVMLVVKPTFGGYGKFYLGLFEKSKFQTYTIDLDGTRYGGTLDVTSGKLTVTDGYIASYDGETLPSTWISDRDVYVADTSPTNGAEVVYKLATPIEVDLTPTEITTLLGTNNIWANTNGNLELTYLADENAS